MTPELKRWYKKQYKLLNILAWITISMFIIGFITLLILIENQLSELWVTIITVMLFVCLISGIILNGISLSHRRELINYKYSIQEYRIRRNYVKAMQYINIGDLTSAVNMYNIIPSDHKCKDYLYISLFHEFK